MSKKLEIKELEVIDHPFLGTLKINFNEKDSNNLNEFYTTLFIGINGTGKSEILRLIIDIFREIESEVKEDKKRYYTNCSYKFKYILKGDVFFINKVKRKKIFYKNEKEVEISEVSIPNSIIGSTSISHDRFPFSNDNKRIRKKSVYHYLGTRTTSGSIGTKSYMKRIIQMSAEKFDNQLFCKNVKKLLKFLSLKKDISIYFDVKLQEELFDGELTVSKLESFFKKKRENRKTEPYSIRYFNNYTAEIKKSTVNFANKISEDLIKYEDSRRYYLEYKVDLNESANNEKLKKEYELLKKLMELDLLSYPTISIKKSDEFDIDEASSGEVNVLLMFLGIMSQITDNSLVLIDEPEVCLHPNWLMKLMTLLYDIFDNYKSSHFIIATHSHFLVSDLRPNSSSIIVFKFEGNKIVVDPIQNKNTYGWSAEDVLFNVFEVPSVRNYYIATKVGNIIDEVEKIDPDVGLIKSKVNQLKKIELNLKKEDPLNQVIKKLVQKYGDK